MKEEFLQSLASDPEFNATEEDARWWFSVLPFILRKWREAEGDRIIHVIRIPIFPNYNITVAKVCTWALFILNIFGINEPTEETLS